MILASEPAPAKINLALHVRRRRPDGRHDIETIFAFCTDGDRLRGSPSDGLTLRIDGPFAGDVSDGGDNLVLQAAEALREAAGVDQGAALQLTKALPVASGIGGGSADAAATLRLLTSLWRIDPAHAAAVAPAIGSDVPACLLSLPARGTGAGDHLELLDDDTVSETPVLLVNPGVRLATRDVFEAWDGVDGGPLVGWRDGRNDLEPAASALVPQISEVLGWLRDCEDASFVRMSGSGATCFALFDSADGRDRAASEVPTHWWRLATSLR